MRLLSLLPIYRQPKSNAQDLRNLCCLPPEILGSIFIHISLYKDYLALQLTCRSCYRAGRTPLVQHAWFRSHYASALRDDDYVLTPAEMRLLRWDHRDYVQISRWLSRTFGDEVEQNSLSEDVIRVIFGCWGDVQRLGKMIKELEDTTLEKVLNIATHGMQQSEEKVPWARQLYENSMTTYTGSLRPSSAFAGMFSNSNDDSALHYHICPCSQPYMHFIMQNVVYTPSGCPDCSSHLCSPRTIQVAHKIFSLQSRQLPAPHETVAPGTNLLLVRTPAIRDTSTDFFFAIDEHHRVLSGRSIYRIDVPVYESQLLLSNSYDSADSDPPKPTMTRAIHSYHSFRDLFDYDIYRPTFLNNLAFNNRTLHPGSIRRHHPPLMTDFYRCILLRDIDPEHGLSHGTLVPLIKLRCDWTDGWILFLGNTGTEPWREQEYKLSSCGVLWQEGIDEDALDV